MTSFLTDLERELRAAHPRRRRARRRAAATRTARRGPAAGLVAAVAALALVFLTPDPEREGRPTAPPAGPPTVAPGPLAVPAGSVAVLDGSRTPGAADAVGRYLSSRFSIARIGDAVRADGTRTVVRHTRGRRSDAFEIARALGDAPRAPLDGPTRAAAGGARIVVEVGRDITGALTGPVATTDGRRVGRVDVLELRGPDAFALDATLRPGRAYGVWARGLDGREVFLGFPPVTTRRGRFRVFAALGRPERVREFILSDEGDEPDVGARPADPVAVARLRRTAGR